MIERIGQRMADFVGTNGVKVVRAVQEIVPGQAPPRRRLVTPSRALLAAGAVVAGVSAVAREVISSNGSRSKGSQAPTRGARASRSPATTARRATMTTANLAEKTRDELYKLACDASIRGRSSMSKDELVKALTRSRRS